MKLHHCAWPFCLALLIVFSSCRKEEEYKFSDPYFAPNATSEDSTVNTEISLSGDATQWKSRAVVDAGVIKLRFFMHKSGNRLTLENIPFSAGTYQFDAAGTQDFASYADIDSITYNSIASSQVAGTLTIDSISNFTIYGTFNLKLADSDDTTKHITLQAASFYANLNHINCGKLGNVNNWEAGFMLGDMQSGSIAAPQPRFEGGNGISSDYLKFSLVYLHGKNTYKKADGADVIYYDLSKAKYVADSVTINLENFYYKDKIKGTFNAWLRKESDSTKKISISNGSFTYGELEQ